MLFLIYSSNFDNYAVVISILYINILANNGNAGNGEMEIKRSNLRCGYNIKCKISI